MHKITAKRQVTVPKTVCNELGLKPGDMVEIFARDGVAHLVRMNSESLAGQFSGLVKGRNMPRPEDLKPAVKARAARKFNGAKM